MATAKELGLREGDIVKVGTNIYDLEPVSDDGTGVTRYGLCGKGLDMTRGARVEVLEASESGCVSVKYLDDPVDIHIKPDGERVEVPEKVVLGKDYSIWNGYMGFIPESLERRS